MPEQLWCLSSACINALLANFLVTDGWLPAATFPLGLIVERAAGPWAKMGHSSFRPRTEELERDKTQKQMVTYVVCREIQSGCTLSYARKRSGGESRLHNLRSIGVGGHINREDLDGVITLGGIYRAVEREIHEEIQVDRRFVRYLGLLSYDSDDVGSVHAGLVFEATIYHEHINIYAKFKHDIIWHYEERMLAITEGFEPWSQLLIRKLFRPDPEPEVEPAAVAAPGEESGAANESTETQS